MVVFDEGDHFIFADPARLNNLLQENLCFAMTGTVFDGNEKGVEMAVIKKL